MIKLRNIDQDKLEKAKKQFLFNLEVGVYYKTSVTRHSNELSYFLFMPDRDKHGYTFDRAKELKDNFMNFLEIIGFYNHSMNDQFGDVATYTTIHHPNNPVCIDITKYEFLTFTGYAPMKNFFEINDLPDLERFGLDYDSFN